MSGAEGPSTPAAIRVPHGPAALERIWKAFPVAVVWWWGQTGELPTLTAALDAREAELPERP